MCVCVCVGGCIRSSMHTAFASSVNPPQKKNKPGGIMRYCRAILTHWYLANEIMPETRVIINEGFFESNTVVRTDVKEYIYYIYIL